MEHKSARAKVRALGIFDRDGHSQYRRFLLPSGFITALFIPTGWMPNEHFAKIVGPMITTTAGDDWFYRWTSGRWKAWRRDVNWQLALMALISHVSGSSIMGKPRRSTIKYIDRLLEQRLAWF